MTQEVPAPADGILDEIILDTDAEALPGAVLGRLGSAAVERVEVAYPELMQSSSTTPDVRPKAEQLQLSPAVRRAVQQHSVDVSAVCGTGRGGRITRADIDKHVAERDAASVRAPEPEPSLPTPAPDGMVAAVPAAGGGGRVRNVPHDRMRLAIAQNMLNSVTVAPHVTAVFEADFSRIMAHARSTRQDFRSMARTSPSPPTFSQPLPRR